MERVSKRQRVRDTKAIKYNAANKERNKQPNTCGSEPAVI
jgi:hypothetical protein